MADRVASHYSENLELAGLIAKHLRSAGKDFQRLTTTDLATVDEFHIRGRKATLELAEKMNLAADSNVLDIGSGLGGPARTLAETYGCRVTGIDLTQAFCDAAAAMSDWVGLGKRVLLRLRGPLASFVAVGLEHGRTIPLPDNRQPILLRCTPLKKCDRMQPSA
jgi:cyclopropane fatty-acyl-phospholipid synthase-like methyltransferase